MRPMFILGGLRRKRLKVLSAYRRCQDPIQHGWITDVRYTKKLL
jgi:hypothetical protein